MSLVESSLVRPTQVEDASAIADIYNHYVRTSVATFETTTVTAAGMADRIVGITRAGYPHLVLQSQSKVRAFAYLNRWKERQAYSRTVEISVYVEAGFTRRGSARRLYAALLDEARQRRYHAILAGIALPNDGSIALHEAFGFTKVAHFRETGNKFGRWVDVGYWQLLLREEPEKSRL